MFFPFLGSDVSRKQWQRGSWGSNLQFVRVLHTFYFLFFLSLLNKNQQLGNWGNKRNPLCKLSCICIMSYARNMQMKRIIYERLCLSHSVPITYKEFFSLLLSPPLQAGTTCTILSDQTHTKQAHPQKRLLAGYDDWVGKNLSGRLMRDKEASSGRGGGRDGWYGDKSTKAQ